MEKSAQNFFKSKRIKIPIANAFVYPFTTTADPLTWKILQLLSQEFMKPAIQQNTSKHKKQKAIDFIYQTQEKQAKSES